MIECVPSSRFTKTGKRVLEVDAYDTTGRVKIEMWEETAATFERLFDGAKTMALRLFVVSFPVGKSNILFGNYSDAVILENTRDIYELKRSAPPAGSVFYGVAEFR